MNKALMWFSNILVLHFIGPRCSEFYHRSRGTHVLKLVLLMDVLLSFGSSSESTAYVRLTEIDSIFASRSLFLIANADGILDNEKGRKISKKSYFFSPKNNGSARESSYFLNDNGYEMPVERPVDMYEENSASQGVNAEKLEGEYRSALNLESSSSAKRERVRVHLVPHSHLDLGWVKTVDQVYTGSNNSIQVSAAQYVLDSLVVSLAESPDRKFSFAEQGFFQRWWKEQAKSTKELVRRLILSGQLEFINGGWSMHDEATTHYVDMIDQMSLGHRSIRRLFSSSSSRISDSEAPPIRIAWQIDPFGHSAVQAYLFSAEAGFDALFFARADYADIAKRRKARSMEFVWRASASLGPKADIFTGILATHYSPPEGFNFDVRSTDPPIQDDPELEDYNVEERVEAFVQAALTQAQQMRGGNIMFLMGQDFCYSNANMWYKNMDKLIRYVNQDGRVEAFYSSPSIYVDAKMSANETWPIKLHGDFFPYADCPHCYWTGYFTSRPAFKGYIRVCSAYLQAARQLEVLMGKKGSKKEGRTLREHEGSQVADRRVKETPLKREEEEVLKSKEETTTEGLEAALALAQHHDAITGTERSHVVSDYTKRLSLGLSKAEKVVNHALEAIILGARGNSRHEEKSEGAIEQLRSSSDEETPSSVSQEKGRKTSNRMSLRMTGVLREDVSVSRPQVKEERKTREAEAASNSMPELTKHLDSIPARLSLQQCPHLNISVCSPTAVLSIPGSKLLLVAYNPLAWTRSEYIRIPVPTSRLRVAKARREGSVVESQVLPLSESATRLRPFYSEAYTGVHIDVTDSSTSLYELVFEINIKPFGVELFQIERLSDSDHVEGEAVLQTPQKLHLGNEQHKNGELIRLSGNFVNLTFSAASGRLSGMSSLSSKGLRVDVEMTHSFRWFNGSDGNYFDQYMQPRGPQASGAYVFRPNSSTDFPVASDNVEAEIVKGPLVEEIRIRWAPWVTEVVRIFRKDRHAEFEFTVGPIPIDDDLGKEVISRFSSSIKSGGEFFTDSNARDYLKRVRNKRSDWPLNVTEPIAANYYPVVAGMFLEGKGVQLSVLTDRAQGGSSHEDGSLELMVHRRLLYDDHRGVAEALNETVCVEDRCEGLAVRGVHYVAVSDERDGPQWRRLTAQRVYSQLLLAFAPVSPRESAEGKEREDDRMRTFLSFSAVEEGYELPQNVAVITLQEMEDGSVLLRLAHIFESKEHEVLSQPAMVDVQKLFRARKVKKMRELSVLAGRKKEASDRLKWRLEAEAGMEEAEERGSLPKFVVRLKAMEIRTFTLELE